MKFHLRLMIKSLKIASHLAPQKVGAFYAEKFMTPRRFTRPDWEKKILQTATQVGVHQGCEFWVWGEGPSILLLHGWEGRASQLGAMVQPLVAAGFRVVMWDAPAHGSSNLKRTDLPHCAQALLEFSQTQPQFFAIIAHSFGSSMAKVARHWGLKIERVVQIASPFLVQDVFDRFKKLTQISPRAGESFQAFIEKAAGHSVKSLDGWSEASERAPTLLIHSDNDRDVPAEDAERELALLASRAELLRVKNLGHRRLLRDPHVIQRVTEFLSYPRGMHLPKSTSCR